MCAFIKKGNKYEKLSGEISALSINGISEQLGYHPDQVYTYCGCYKDKKISTITFEIFTKNIAFILSQSGVENIEQKDVDFALKDFDTKYEYGSHNAQDILQRGIDNKSLRVDFLSKVLHIKDPDDNGLFYIESLGLDLFFIDGILTDFQTSDGLSVWAKHWKELNPAMFRDYENVARKFWGNNLPMVIKEVNKQADAWSLIPQAMNNEFIPLHRTIYGTINFFMLNVCHYTKTIRLSEFLEINHGRYKEVNPLFGNSLITIKQYNLDSFTYEFTEDGVLLRYYYVK